MVVWWLAPPLTRRGTPPLGGASSAFRLCPAADDGPAARQREMEYAGVRYSLENLKTFPFVQDRLAAGDLRLRGAFFDIADGRLLALDPETGSFEALG